jgi:hypothetical protein
MPTDATEDGTPRTVLVDLGKKKRKKVKQLRKGHGQLLDQVNDVIADLKEAGEVNADADTVVVIVERKSRGRRFGW